MRNESNKRGPKTGLEADPGVTRRQLMAGAALVAASSYRSMPALALAQLGVIEVAGGIFVHQGRYELFTPANHGDISNPAFVIGNDAVAVIDTGGSAGVGKALRDAIRALTDRPIRYVINTHMHPDHVFGNAAFKGDNPAFVGHHKLARALSARAERYLAANRINLGEEAFAGTEIILPTVAIEGRHEIDLGGRRLTLEAQKTAHTDNDLTIRDGASDTLFSGDLVFSGHIPTLDGSIVGWLAVAERLAAQPAARVVPGHGPPSMPWPDAIRPVQRYFQTIAKDVREMIKAGKTLGEATKTAGQSEKDAWLLFDEFNARNVSAAFAELEWE